MSFASSLSRSLAGIGRTVLDAILPPRCLSCAGAVDRQGTLCLSCWSGLTFISPPHCACCGEPFDVTIVVDAADSLLCATCIGEPPAYNRARSVLSYDDGCRGMILGFKHADQTYAATAFGAWLARAGADLLVPGAVLAPVPLHRWKLFSRRYNQAALLAHAVGHHANLDRPPQPAGPPPPYDAPGRPQQNRAAAQCAWRLPRPSPAGGTHPGKAGCPDR